MRETIIIKCPQFYQNLVIFQQFHSSYHAFPESAYIKNSPENHSSHWSFNPVHSPFAPKIWLVVGPPLWKIWVRQLGWLFPIYGKIIQMATKPPTWNCSFLSKKTPSLDRVYDRLVHPLLFIIAYQCSFSRVNQHLLLGHKWWGS